MTECGVVSALDHAAWNDQCISVTLQLTVTFSPKVTKVKSTHDI